MYAVIDGNVTKSNTANLSAKWHRKYYRFIVAVSRFIHTARGHGPCSRDTKPTTVNTGREHRRKI